MKRFKFTALALGLFAFCASTNVQAQQRSVDLQPTISSPTSGFAFTNGGNVQITVTVTNNGPDDLAAGDTIFYKIPYPGTNNNVADTILTQPLAMGQSMTIVNGMMALSINGISDTTTADLCFRVYSPSMIEINNIPVVSTYVDGDTSNNSNCVSVTVYPNPNGGGGGGDDNDSLAINDVYKNKLTLKVYPNPAQSTLYFNAPSLIKASDLTAVVTDLTGRVVLKQIYNRVEANQNAQLKLNVSELNSGMYFIRLNAGNQNYVGKFTIRK